MLENVFWRIITVWFVDLCLAKWWVMSKAEIIYNDVEPWGRSQSFCIRRSTLLTTSTCVKNLPRPLPADFLCTFSRRRFLMNPPAAPVASASTGIFDVKWGWAGGLRVEVGSDRLREGHGSGGEQGGVGCETISGSLLTLPAHTLHSTSFFTWANLLLELMNKCCKVICSKRSQIKNAVQLP